MTTPKVPTWDEAVEAAAIAMSVGGRREIWESTHETMKALSRKWAESVLRAAGLTPEHFEQLAALEWVEAGDATVERKWTHTDDGPWEVCAGRTADEGAGSTLVEAVALARGEGDDNG